MNKKINLVLFTVLMATLFSGCSTSQGSEKEEVISSDLSTASEKTVVFFGDSITQNFENESKSYPDMVSQLTGIKAINLGFGGTSLSVHPNKAFDAFAFHSLADAIVHSDYTDQENALTDPEVPEYFEEKLKNLEAINWDEVDIMTVMYGANDWGNPIENESDLKDITTFKGSGRYSIEKILTEYPHLEIFFIPSIYRFWPDYGNVDSDSSVNTHGLKPREYSDAMAELAKEFKFPYTDTLYGLGINKYNRHLYFNSVDGTHPNELGTQKIAKKVAQALLLNF